MAIKDTIMRGMPQATMGEKRSSFFFFPREENEEKCWWKKAVVYQIYPRSFADGNNDGIGDLRGILQRLNYFVSLGVDTIWLSPIYKSPMVDFGYDVQDFEEIDPIFGTMDEFDALMSAMHHRGLKLVMDFVPNHTSTQHEWFLKSVKKEEPYTSFYVWAMANGETEEGAPIPPNNWLSNFGGSAWEYNEQRKQFYLHNFAVQQADLNYRNPLVVQRIKDVLKFWFRKGVSGFRMDAIAFLLHDKELKDEPEVEDADDVQPGHYDSLQHIYTVNQPGLMDILQEFRLVFEEYSALDNFDRLMLTEAYLPVEEIMPFYEVSQIPFNFTLLNLKKGFTADELHTIIDEWMSSLPEDKYANWVIGNHDNHRIATRLGPELVDGLNMLLLLLPGIPITYYGEEIGMVDGVLSFEETVDYAGLNAGPDKYEEASRDPERTPMQWDDTTHAGFSTADSTWLPVNPNYVDLNVEAQKSSKPSHLSIYKELVSLRASYVALINGDMEMMCTSDGAVFVFSRISDRVKGTRGFVIVLNTSGKQVVVNLPRLLQRVPSTATVLIKSCNWEDPTVNISVDTKEFELGPYNAAVLEIHPAAVRHSVFVSRKESPVTSK